VALRAEVIDFIGLQIVDEAVARGGVAQVAVVQEKLHAEDMRVLVQVIDALRVERAGAADDAVHFVTFGEKQLGEVGTILASDTGD